MTIKLKNNEKKNVKTSQKELLSFLGFRRKIDYKKYKKKKRLINKRAKSIFKVPHPFLKWAGGKRQLIEQFDKHFPENFNKYIEPFVGGGAIFFYLLPEKAILIDNNAEIINCYQVIQNNVDELVKSLQKHKNKTDYFYKIRNVDRTNEFKSWSDIKRASRTMYLNRCCYNGLYRVNSKGEFNVPFGRYKNPNFCDEKNLRAVNIVLKNVEIYQDSFEKCLNFAEAGDFIYLDPPYYPISNTNFTSYTKDKFRKQDQLKLFEVFRKLDKMGCKLMLSNSFDEFILDLYGNYKIITIHAKRAINSKADRRGKIKEVLVLN